MEFSNNERIKLNAVDYANKIIKIMNKYRLDTKEISAILEEYYKDKFYTAPELHDEVSTKYKIYIFKYIVSLRHEFNKNIDKIFSEFFNKYT